MRTTAMDWMASGPEEGSLEWDSDSWSQYREGMISPRGTESE